MVMKDNPDQPEKVSPYCKIPQAHALRLMATAVRALIAPTWNDTQKLLSSPSCLLVKDDKSDGILEGLAVSAVALSEPETAQQLRSFQIFLQHCRATGMPSSIDQDKPTGTVWLERFTHNCKEFASSPFVSFLLQVSELLNADSEYLDVDDEAALDELVVGWRKTVESQLFTGLPLTLRLDMLNAGGLSLYARYDKIRQSKDFTAAENIFQSATSQSPDNWPNRSKYIFNLGGLYLLRCRNGFGSPIDLKKSIEYIQQSVSLDQSNGTFRYHLAVTLNERYKRIGDLYDLDRAIHEFERAIIVSDASEWLKGAAYGQLGNALRSRFLRYHNSTDLDRAVDLQRRALDLSETDDEGMASRWNNLGCTLLERAGLSDGIEEVTEAINCFHHASQLSAPTAFQYPARLNNLGNGLAKRFDRTHDTQALDEAIDAYRQAIRFTPSLAQELTSRLYNLANTLRSRLEVTKSSDESAEVSDLYRKACVSGLERDHQWGLFASRNWGEWAGNSGQWKEASEAYGYGFQIIDRLVDTQISRGNKEVWLSELQQFSAEAAYAHYMNGDAVGAAVSLEQGRAYLLSEALQLKSRSLGRLHDIGRSDLVQAYEVAASRMTAFSDQEGVQEERIHQDLRFEEIRKAREEMDALVLEIRKTPGFDRFAGPPIFEDILTASERSPILYVAAAKAGGLALIVRSDKKKTVKAISLPHLNHWDLRKRVQEYQSCYNRSENDPDSWQQALDDTTRWLYRSLMGPVLRTLKGISRATIVPCGLLSLLPLHAAWKPLPNGKRFYAIDKITIVYAPNARTLSLMQSIARGTKDESILIVTDPKPTSQEPLPFANYETKAAASTFHRRKVLSRQAARAERAKQLIPKFRTVHLACHALVDPDNPLNSGLLLAQDERLSLHDILSLDLEGMRLVVLSACETAVPGAKLPDEVISLGVGFLQAGAEGVIASQWSVLDESTMLLMTKFYKLWRFQKIHPADALRQAQLWMRSTSDRTKAKDVKNFVPASVYRRLARTHRNTHTFLHPDNWAAFTYVGS